MWIGTARYVIVGDTIACDHRRPHVRLVGIDAPELPGHCWRAVRRYS